MIGLFSAIWCLAALPGWNITSFPVNVVVDVLPAGKKLPPPSPQHPQFYFPVFAPYQTEGASYGGEEQVPPMTEVARLVATALAQQGYVYYGAAHQKPTLVIEVLFGSMNPVVQMFQKHPVLLNQAEMVGLMQGFNASAVADRPWENRDFWNEIAHNRFFVMISAYQYDTYKTRHRVLYWQARMSVPAAHADFVDAFQPMIEAGAPLLGRDARPQVYVKPVPQGRVDVGEPTVKP